MASKSAFGDLDNAAHDLVYAVHAILAWTPAA
jgi:hypothetical protein